jgi:hypothetical protein
MISKQKNPIHKTGIKSNCIYSDISTFYISYNKRQYYHPFHDLNSFHRGESNLFETESPTPLPRPAR